MDPRPQALRMEPLARRDLARPLLQVLMISFLLTSLGLSLGMPHPGRAEDKPTSPSQTTEARLEARAASRIVWLPDLGPMDLAPACQASISVQNVGHDLSKATILFWGEAGFCPPQSAGPLKLECSGLIRPGSSWTFTTSQIPTGSHSGMIVSFIARPLSELGLEAALGFDDIAADLMCETLFFGVVGDADDSRRFLQAYRKSLAFASIPQDRVQGSPLAVEVVRDCADPDEPDVLRTSAYAGIADWRLGRLEPDITSFKYLAPMTHRPPIGDSVSTIIVQNAGLECASIELEIRSEDSPPEAEPPCRLFQLTLAPGEQQRFRLSDCQDQGASGGMGAALIRGNQPLAIVVDTAAGDARSSYSAVTLPADSVEVASDQGRIHVAPLVYHDFHGWTSRVFVQNASAAQAARVKAFFLDRSGDIIVSMVADLPPSGSHRFDLADVQDMPGSWVGSLRVESQELRGADGSAIWPAIAAVVESRRQGEEGTNESFAYGLPASMAWPSEGEGDASGAGLIAIPYLQKDKLDEQIRAQEIAIANVRQEPGFTDFAILIYDQNGMLDFICSKLAPQQVEYFSLATLGFINPGFRGSAVISATVWEHEVVDARGNVLHNPVGLAAVSALRPPSPPGEPIADAAGDGSRAILGVAIPSGAEAEFLLGSGISLCGLPASPETTSTAWPTPLPSPTPRTTPTVDASPSAPSPPTATGTPATPTPTAWIPWVDSYFLPYLGRSTH